MSALARRLDQGIPRESCQIFYGDVDRGEPAVTTQCAAASAPARRSVASICVGALILAAAVLLDGRRATAHWRKADSPLARANAARTPVGGVGGLASTVRTITVSIRASSIVRGASDHGPSKLGASAGTGSMPVYFLFGTTERSNSTAVYV
ncbi:hypothetical protein IC762_29845 [Bradyrhizobium genosp. L]|uniref:hypothetical protein n=1 Tax=Bradyrhizobium genosp. L TaxID=83637 RepID=UPI0018A2BD5D|nr:hypothetical protein IC762_29845 [Bradyrhizobium genosp. L]